MQLKPAVKPWSKQGLKQILLVAFCYWFFLMMTKWTTLILPYLEIRFATFVPVVGGLVFGIPGALGAALGNFMGDLGGDTPLPLRFLAGYENFLLAYLPYRLWYAWQGNEAAKFVYNKRSYRNYVLIAMLAALHFAVALSASIEIFFHIAGAGFISFVVLFGNNFIYPVLIGIPALMFLLKRKQTFYYPECQAGVRQTGQQAMLVLLTLVHLGFITAFEVGLTDVTFCTGYALLSLVFLTYICTIPSHFQPQAEENFVSVAADIFGRLLSITTGITLLAIVLISLMGNTVVLFDSTSAVQRWGSFYARLMFMLMLILTAVYFFLAKLERNAIQPLAGLSKAAASFVETGKLKEESKLEVRTSFKNEIDFLEYCFQKMSQDVQLYFHNMTAAKEKEHALQAQLDVATQIQQGVLPNLEGVNAWFKEQGYPYRVQGGLEAARNVGGDLFDCFPLDKKRIFLCIGDVSGKGIPAALFAMVTQALLGNTSLNLGKGMAKISDVVAHTNDALEEHNKEALFVTLWAGILNLQTGTLTYVNAGHNPPLIYAKDTNTITWVKEISGPVLGLMPDMIYTVRKVNLPSQGRLLLYTDGFNEAENLEHEFFGNERLEQSFAKYEHVEELLAEVKAFVKDAPPSDDKTYLWLDIDKQSI